MHPLLLALLALPSARADALTLDSGATIEGDLARYELGGDCQISVTEGDLLGTIVILPCHRIVSFVRTEPAVPVLVAVVDADASDEVPAAYDMHADLPTLVPVVEEASPTRGAAAPDAASLPPPEDRAAAPVVTRSVRF